MNLSTVILAAGLSTRMKSSIPKVLHSLYEKPIIRYVLDAVLPLEATQNIVVIGPKSNGVKSVLDGYPVLFAVQREQKGTADALRMAVPDLKRSGGTILVLNGDTPLIKTSTLRRILDLHRRRGEVVSLISFLVEGPHSYGRILRRKREVVAVIEDRDATKKQREIREVNSGIYALEAQALDLLDEIPKNESKGEYYLTDLVERAVKRGYRVGAHVFGSEAEFTGINTRGDLHAALHALRDEIVSGWMDRGVTFIDRAAVFIHPDAEIGMDTVIYPNVHVEGRTVIGRDCKVCPNTRIIESVIGDGVLIKDATVIESSTVKDRASIGPFAHLRPGSIIGASCKIGNFVEVKKSVIGDGTKASHLSYLGDAEVGKNVNIGAGTITCNYDGTTKHKTVIEDGVFIGSDTQLIAPVSVGEGAYVGAGSTITKDVPPHSLALSRAAQKTIEKWALKKRRAGSTPRSAAGRGERSGGKKMAAGVMGETEG